MSLSVNVRLPETMLLMRFRAAGVQMASPFEQLAFDPAIFYLLGRAIQSVTLSPGLLVNAGHKSEGPRDLPSASIEPVELTLTTVPYVPAKV